jgi:hypothetical protein
VRRIEERERLGHPPASPLLALTAPFVQARLFSTEGHP